MPEARTEPKTPKAPCLDCDYDALAERIYNYVCRVTDTAGLECQVSSSKLEQVIGAILMDHFKWGPFCKDHAGEIRGEERLGKARGK